MGFAMRLYHMGVPVAVEGDMTTPPVGPGDLFLLLSRDRLEEDLRDLGVVADDDHHRRDRLWAVYRAGIIQ